MANVVSNLRGLLTQGIAYGFMVVLALSVVGPETVSEATFMPRTDVRVPSPALVGYTGSFSQTWPAPTATRV